MTQLLWLMRIDFTKLHVRKMFLDHLPYREYRARRSEDGRKQNMLLKSIEHPERLWTTFLRIYGHITARCVTQDLLFASTVEVIRYVLQRPFTWTRASFK